MRSSVRSGVCLLLAAWLPSGAGAQERAPEGTRLTVDEAVIPFDWDLVSLEQNNPRFNASVLSGFHSVRSPGVTPHRGWKTGIGLLFSREEQVAVTSNTELFEREQLTLNPRLNYGLLPAVEVGAGFEFVWTEGKELINTSPGGTDAESAWEASAVGLGVKWAFLDTRPLRLALSFDSRVAINRNAFGTLDATVYNVEIDGDYAITSRFLIAGNLQFMTSDLNGLRDQVILDVAGQYAFSDRFRGMLFSTAIEDDEADDILFFIGFAGQYVIEQHSFTLALDFQLNDANREIRTERQLDVELTYTFTF